MYWVTQGHFAVMETCDSLQDWLAEMWSSSREMRRSSNATVVEQFHCLKFNYTYGHGMNQPFRPRAHFE